MIECNRHNPIEDPPDELDAFGHLNWTVNSLEDQPDGGEWMACFDAIYNLSTGLVDYHVVIDTESFTDTPERGSVAPAEIDGLKGLPERYHYIGIEQGLLMDDEALKATSERWNAHIDQLKESIPKDRPDEYGPSENPYIKAARRMWHRDGEIEIDDSPLISTSDADEGAYVQAWVWVSCDDLCILDVP